MNSTTALEAMGLRIVSETLRCCCLPEFPTLFPHVVQGARLNLKVTSLQDFSSPSSLCDYHPLLSGLRRAGRASPSHQSQPSSVIYLQGGLPHVGGGPLLGSAQSWNVLSRVSSKKGRKVGGWAIQRPLSWLAFSLRSPRIRGIPPLLGGQDLPQLN